MTHYMCHCGEVHNSAERGYCPIVCEPTLGRVLGVSTQSAISVATDEWNRRNELFEATMAHLRANEAFGRALAEKDSETFKRLQDENALAETWDRMVAAGRAFEPFEFA